MIIQLLDVQKFILHIPHINTIKFALLKFCLVDALGSSQINSYVGIVINIVNILTFNLWAMLRLDLLKRNLFW